MLKPLLIRTMLVYGVSTIGFTIYFAVARTTWTTPMGPVPGTMLGLLLLLIFLFALYWALIPTALYLVGEFILKRTQKKEKTLGVNHF
jgi:hypothetical protein